MAENSPYISYRLAILLSHLLCQKENIYLLMNKKFKNVPENPVLIIIRGINQYRTKYSLI